MIKLHATFTWFCLRTSPFERNFSEFLITLPLYILEKLGKCILTLDLNMVRWAERHLHIEPTFCTPTLDNYQFKCLVYLSPGKIFLFRMNESQDNLSYLDGLVSDGILEKEIYEKLIVCHSWLLNSVSFDCYNEIFDYCSIAFTIAELFLNNKKILIWSK